MNLEHELRQALKRKDPGSGFDTSVLGKLRSGAVDARASRRPRWTRLALPVAASLMLTATGSYYALQHQRQQRQIRAEQAAYDLVLALEIASAKVSAVQVKVQEMTHHEGQVPY